MHDAALHAVRLARPSNDQDRRTAADHARQGSRMAAAAGML